MIGIEQVRRVEVLGAVVLGEDAAVVDALRRRISALHLVGRGLPTARRARRRRARGRGAAPRSTATQHITFDATKCCGSPRISQMPWSGSGRVSMAWSTSAGDARPRRWRRSGRRCRWCDADRVEEHPPHVVLVLVERAVADAHRPRVAVAGEVVERVLGEVGLAADAVHDLQVELAVGIAGRRPSRA